MGCVGLLWEMLQTDHKWSWCETEKQVDSVIYMDKLGGDVEDRTIYTISAVYLIDLYYHWQQKAQVGKPLLYWQQKEMGWRNLNELSWKK